MQIQHSQWVESPTENCVSLVIDYAKRNNINLIPGDFDACHRIGTKENSKLRPILVKFVRREHARSILQTRAKQRYDKTKIFVNEDLTSSRATAAREARAIVKINKIVKSYVYSGKIFIETNDGQTHSITNINQQNIYGR